MSPVTLNFSRTEYDQRLAKARAAMAERGLDLLIVTDPSNMAWLTGYDGWSFYVHQCVVLALNGEPLWYGRLLPLAPWRPAHFNRLHQFGSTTREELGVD